MSGKTPAAGKRSTYRHYDVREIVKAAIAVLGVLVVTIVAIWLLDPGDSSSAPTPAPATSVSSTPLTSSPAASTPAPSTGSAPAGQP